MRTRPLGADQLSVLNLMRRNGDVIDQIVLDDGSFVGGPWLVNAYGILGPYAPVRRRVVEGLEKRGLIYHEDFSTVRRWYVSSVLDKGLGDGPSQEAKTGERPK